jgi:signal transduction histidine kinase
MDRPPDQTNRLLALIVHELRAPAGVVSGYLRMVARSRALERSSPDRQMIDDAAKTCARLLRVVQEIDDLCNLDDPDYSRSLDSVPLFALSDEVVREAVANGEAVSFECPESERSVIVRGEPGRIKRSLAALLAFTVREHGKLPVHVTAFTDRSRPEGSAVVSFSGKDGGLTPGTVLESQSSELDRWRGGMGLLVPLACRIVEVHGGRVWSVPATPLACALKIPLAPA